MEKTNTSRSPLLRPVIERDYTKGISINSDSGTASSAQPAASSIQPPPGGAQSPGVTAQPGPSQQKFNIPPPDSTKEFSFDEMHSGDEDKETGDFSGGINIPTGSAKTFANFVANAVKIYLPRVSYDYVKIDIENVIVNVEKRLLTANWIPTFTKINETTEEALKIPEESIKMWEKALQHFLEYKQLAFANPVTEFVVASILLLTDQGVRVYSIKKTNEQYMKQAIEASNPETLGRKPSQTEKTESNGTDKKAA